MVRGVTGSLRCDDGLCQMILRMSVDRTPWSPSSRWRMRGCRGFSILLILCFVAYIWGLALLPIFSSSSSSGGYHGFNVSRKENEVFLFGCSGPHSGKDRKSKVSVPYHAFGRFGESSGGVGDWENFPRRLSSAVVVKNPGSPMKTLEDAGNVRDIVGMVLISIACMVAVAAGTGGGSVYVPIMTLLMGFPTHSATVMSQCLMCGGVLAGTFLNLCRRHPLTDRPLVDLDMVIFLGPAQMAGVSFGQVVNRCLPTWLIVFLLVLVLSVGIFKTTRQFMALIWRSKDPVGAIGALQGQPELGDSVYKDVGPKDCSAGGKAVVDVSIAGDADGAGENSNSVKGAGRALATADALSSEGGDGGHISVLGTINKSGGLACAVAVTGAAHAAGLSGGASLPLVDGVRAWSDCVTGDQSAATTPKITVNYRSVIQKHGIQGDNIEFLQGSAAAEHIVCSKNCISAYERIETPDFGVKPFSVAGDNNVVGQVDVQASCSWAVDDEDSRPPLWSTERRSFSSDSGHDGCGKRSWRADDVEAGTAVCTQSAMGMSGSSIDLHWNQAFDLCLPFDDGDSFRPVDKDGKPVTGKKLSRLRKARMQAARLQRKHAIFKWLLTGIIWGGDVTLGVLRGEKIATSGLVAYCSVNFWLIYAAAACGLLLCSSIQGFFLFQEQRARDHARIERVEGDLVYNFKTLSTFYMQTTCAGIVAGTVGIGSSMVMGPVMLVHGMLPSVTTAVNTALVLLSSSNAATKSLVGKSIPGDYCGVLFGLCFVSALIGKFVIDRIVRKNKADHILVFLLIIIMVASMGCMLASGIIGLLKTDSDGFRSPC